METQRKKHTMVNGPLDEKPKVHLDRIALAEIFYNAYSGGKFTLEGMTGAQVNTIADGASAVAAAVAGAVLDQCNLRDEGRRSILAKILNPPNINECEEQVIKLIRQRRSIGRSKYGCTMEREDLAGVDWLRHLQAELLDGAIYAQRLIKDAEKKGGADA